ncbi:MAG: acetylglutamate kinase [Gammaproteobacteria bacterium]|nr:acetylglutamate kinase [Gammaproteobacteria bacterium]
MPYKLVLLETARKLADQHNFDGAALREAIPYLEAFQGKKFVLKIGGSVLQDERLIPQLVSDVVFLKRLDIEVVLVHGGARQLDRHMQARGLEPSKLDGLRVTSREVLDLADEVFLEISRVVRDAVVHRGYRGVIFDRTSGLVRSRQKDAGLGYVGEPERVDASLLDQLPAEAVPIVTAITSGLEDGDPGYNVNADEVASAIAAEIRAEKLILMTDEDGVKDGSGILLPTLTRRQAEAYINTGVIHGGMIPKVRACLEPLERGVSKSHIIRGDADSFINEILTDAGVGTEFVRE